MPFSKRVTEFLDRAEACRQAAERTKSPDIRDTYLVLAEQWEIVARQIEELEAELNRGRRSHPPPEANG